MPETASLELVEQGVATAAEARKAIAAILKQTGEEGVSAVYTALRAWVWKALDGRRRDPELREWYGLLESIEGRLASKHREQAYRIQVLYELVSESIAVAETVSADQVLEREHVRAILALLRNSGNGELERAAIGERLALKQANLTRVLNLMSLAGLIERQPRGREAIFRLTAFGQTEAAKLPTNLANESPTQRLDQELHLRRLVQNTLPELKTNPTLDAHWVIVMSKLHQQQNLLLLGNVNEKTKATFKALSKPHATSWLLAPELIHQHADD